MFDKADSAHPSCLFYLSPAWFLLKFHTKTIWKSCSDGAYVCVMHVLASHPRKLHLSFFTLILSYFHFTITSHFPLVSLQQWSKFPIPSFPFSPLSSSHVRLPHSTYCLVGPHSHPHPHTIQYTHTFSEWTSVPSPPPWWTGIGSHCHSVWLQPPFDLLGIYGVLGLST